MSQKLQYCPHAQCHWRSDRKRCNSLCRKIRYCQSLVTSCDVEVVDSSVSNTTFLLFLIFTSFSSYLLETHLIQLHSLLFVHNQASICLNFLKTVWILFSMCLQTLKNPPAVSQPLFGYMAAHLSWVVPPILLWRGQIWRLQPTRYPHSIPAL